MFKVLLCIPPDYDYNFPPLGTPALCGFLKNKGIETYQIDLNLKYRDFLIRHIRSSSLFSYPGKKSFLKAILKKFFYENLKGRYYSYLLPRLNDEMLPYLPYENNSISSFYFTERLLSSEHLFRYLEDINENIFYQFYEDEKFLGFLDKEKINLLGISIISPSQVIASLTLCLLVKKYLPHIHINIGGQWPTLYRKALLERKDFFRCFDSIVVFEGETPLYRLTEALKAQKNIAIPNVILQDSASDFSDNRTEENLDDLPCPDFDGLPLVDYEGEEQGKMAVTFETSRGCYWAKCAYCVDLPLPKPSYRRKNPKLVVKDIKELRKKYQVGHLMLGDLGLSPRQMLEVSREILKEGIEITWWSMARLDPGFNYKIFKTAAQAGLKQINFGFESANDHICELLHKGNKKERSAKIIRECARSGIKVDLQTMLGLPKETFNNGLETVDFLIKHRKFISDVTFNIYYLTPGNFIYQNPQKYAIEFQRDPSLPFRFFLPFNNPCGISENEAVLLQKLYYQLSTEHSPEDQNHKFTPDKPLELTDNIEEGWIELELNQEASRVFFLKEQKNQESLLLEDREKEIVGSLKQGLTPSQIYNYLSRKYSKEKAEAGVSFIEESLLNRFFTCKSNV